MTGFARLLVPAVLLAVSACQPSVDLAAAAASDSLLATDRTWGELAGSNADVDSIVGYWTADAKVLLPGQPEVIGTEAIRAMVSGTRAVPGFSISWIPDSAIVFPSGDVGYTFGKNRITAPDAAGALHTMVGRYITIWRRETDGRWRCFVDISNEGPAAAEPVRDSLPTG